MILEGEKSKDERGREESLLERKEKSGRTVYSMREEQGREERSRKEKELSPMVQVYRRVGGRGEQKRALRRGAYHGGDVEGAKSSKKEAQVVEEIVGTDRRRNAVPSTEKVITVTRSQKDHPVKVAVQRRSRGKRGSAEDDEIGHVSVGFRDNVREGCRAKAGGR